MYSSHMFNVIRQTDMSTIEDIVFMNHWEEDYSTVMDLIADGCECDAIEYLMQWHFPGEHETRDTYGAGLADSTYSNGGYTLTWNSTLGYVGLEYSEE